ncbi:MAG: hypothetical protein ACFFCS_09205, partial [Candidatus Hodarchaeota archaeon]
PVKNESLETLRLKSVKSLIFSIVAFPFLITIFYIVRYFFGPAIFMDMMIWIYTVLSIVVIIAGIIWVVYYSYRCKHDPVAVLDMRLAKGEVSEEEYKRLKKLLESKEKDEKVKGT